MLPRYSPATSATVSGSDSSDVAVGLNASSMRPALRYGRNLTRREPCIGGDDFHDDRRDVVDAAVVVRVGDHCVDDSLGIRPRLKQLLQPLVFDHSRETVRSEKKYVAYFGLAADDVGLDIARHSDAAGDDVALRMMSRLLRGNDSRVDLLLHQRMVPCELPHFAVANEVDPRISN